jgi:hypothetical protein
MAMLTHNRRHKRTVILVRSMAFRGDGPVLRHRCTEVPGSIAASWGQIFLPD